jgi:glycine betaine/proline transport system ATP-binding protein
MRDGRFVQVGTPESVVVEPADEYVENFVRDVPRSFVVPVEHVMRAVDDSAQFSGSVPMGTKVRDIVKLIAHSEFPVQVVDATGTQVGCVDRVHVLALIAGSEP